MIHAAVIATPAAHTAGFTAAIMAACDFDPTNGKSDWPTLLKNTFGAGAADNHLTISVLLSAPAPVLLQTIHDLPGAAVNTRRSKVDGVDIALLTAPLHLWRRALRRPATLPTWTAIGHAMDAGGLHDQIHGIAA